MFSSTEHLSISARLKAVVETAATGKPAGVGPCSAPNYPVRDRGWLVRDRMDRKLLSCGRGLQRIAATFLHEGPELNTFAPPLRM